MYCVYYKFVKCVSSLPCMLQRPSPVDAFCGLGPGRDRPHRPTETHLPLSSEIERVAMVILSYVTHFACFLHQGGVYFVNSR